MTILVRLFFKRAYTGRKKMNRSQKIPEEKSIGVSGS